MLLTVSLQLLTILSFDLYSGVTKYYSETFGGGACVASHQRSTNTGCLVCIPYHFSQSLFTGKDDACVLPDTPVQSLCTQVRAHLLPSMAFWLGSVFEEPGMPAHRRQCRRGHPPTILARKPPAHLAQQPHQPSPVLCCRCIGLQSLYSGSQQGLQLSLGRRMLKPQWLTQPSNFQAVISSELCSSSALLSALPVHVRKTHIWPSILFPDGNHRACLHPESRLC